MRFLRGAVRGPHRFAQNRPLAFLSAIDDLAGSRRPKSSFARFSGLFDFRLFDSIDPKRKSTLPIYFKLRDLPLIERKRRFAKHCSAGPSGALGAGGVVGFQPALGLGYVTLFGIGSIEPHGRICR